MCVAYVYYMRSILILSVLASTALGCGSSSSHHTQGLALAGDGTDVYAADYVDGRARILKVAPDGTFVVLTSQPANAVAAQLVLDGGFVYYTVGEATATPTPHGIQRVPVGGGEATQVASGTIARFALDETSLYWLEAGAELEGGTIWKAPKTGGVPAMVASTSGRPYSLAVNGSDVFFATSTYSGLDQVHALHRVPKNGGSPVTLPILDISPSFIEATNDTLYWTDEGDGRPPSSTSECVVCRPAVVKVPIAGGAPVVLTDTLDGHAVGLGRDGTSLFVLTERESGAEYVTSTSSLLRLSTNGGAPATLGSGWSFPKGFALQGGSAVVFSGGAKGDEENITRVGK
jgi:hypothetical protein